MKKTGYITVYTLLLALGLPLCGFCQPDALTPVQRTQLRNRAMALRSATHTRLFAPLPNNPQAQPNARWVPDYCEISGPGVPNWPGHSILIWYKYNAAGQLISDSWVLRPSGDSTRRHEYAYDSAGNVSSLNAKKWNAALSAWVPDSLVQYTYDAYNNLTEQLISTYDSAASNWVIKDGTKYGYVYQAGNVKTINFSVFIGGGYLAVIKDSVVRAGTRGEPIEMDADILPMVGGGRAKVLFSGWHNWVSPHVITGGYQTGTLNQEFRNGRFVNSGRSFTHYSGTTNLMDSSTSESADTNGNFQSVTIYKNEYQFDGNNNVHLFFTFTNAGFPYVAYRKTYEFFNYMSLGLTGGSSKTGITAYPNPFANSLNVQIAAPAAYTLTDLSGKVLFKGTLVPQSGRAVLSTETLPQGMYLLNTAGSVLKVVKE